MPAGNPYIQTGIGDCGHIVTMWPLVRSLTAKGAFDSAVCDECTREKYKLSPADVERLGVWVRVSKDSPEVKEAKRVTRKASPKKKTVRCSLCSKTGHIYTDCSLMNNQALS